MKRTFSIGAALLICSAAAMAQYTNVLEGGTNLIVNSAWTNDTVWVGQTTSSNTMQITDGGMVFSTNAFVGATSNANDNTVSVTGTGSWTIEDTLEIGSGTNNTVSVGGGGTISAGNLVIHTNNDFNLNNGGKLDISGNLDAGQEGFNWNDGGHLDVGGALSGLVELDGNDKQLSLDGGSWNLSTNDLVVGATGTGNVVTVTNDGLVSASSVVVHTNNDFNLGNGGKLHISGNLDAGQSGFNWTDGGKLTVEGELSGITALDQSEQTLVLNGGTWDLGTSDLVVGSVGSGNQLIINNGGTVTNASAAIGVSGSSNAVKLTNARWINSGNLTIGNTGSLNTLAIQQGAFVTNDTAIVGAGLNANSNRVLVTGIDAQWAMAGTLTVGATNNMGNQVTVTNGGSVAVGGLTVADGNDFNLETKGKLTVSGSFDAGQSGFNWGNGSTLAVQSNLTGLVTIAGEQQTLRLEGGSMTNALKSLNVGWNYSGNIVEVEDGGSITMDTVRIGQNAGENAIIVSGTNSAMEIAGTLSVGYGGSGNRLEIGPAGRVTNAVAYVGFTPSASNNTVTVSGAGAEWINGTLNVGWFTNDVPPGTMVTNKLANSGNSVTVTEGGLVQAASLSIQDGNDFYLNDGGTLRMTGDFDLTNDDVKDLNWGEGGTLSVGGNLDGITNVAGGRVLTLDGSASRWDDAAGTNMVISGAAIVNVTNGAVVNAGNLDVLDDGSSVYVASNAWLLVGDGAATAIIPTGGLMVAATNGATLTVSNEGSVTVEETLQVGSGSTAGTVSVSDGGTITAGAVNIAAGSSFNLNDQGTATTAALSIDGTGTFNLNDGGTLSMTTNFNANLGGFEWKSGGHLSVGGELSGMSGVFDGTNRILSINGGSWNEGLGSITVGETGSSNTLNVINGGVLINGDGFVGNASNAWNNTVEVSGSGSVWNNSGTLQIGYLGSYEEIVGSETNTVYYTSGGNSVTVGDGGAVFADTLVIRTNNTFNLSDGGTLRMTGDFDLANDNVKDLNWGEGGNLSVGGNLDGITNVTGGRVLTLDGAGARWDDAAGTNMVISGGAIVNVTNGAVAEAGNLIVKNAASVLNVSPNAWMLVGEGASTNALGALGGLMVASTNGATVSVENGTVMVGSLHVGSGSATGTVDVLAKGTVVLNDLVIAADTNNAFNLAGKLEVVSSTFDGSQEGFNWLSNGDLVMTESQLYGISEMTGTNKSLTINGGSWTNSGALGINGDNNTLSAESSSNTFSTITSAGAVIGESTNDFGNSVTLNGTNTLWSNSGDLTVGDAGSGNSFTVEGGATNINSGSVYIGIQAGASNNTVTVAGTNSSLQVGDSLFVQNGSTLELGSGGQVEVGTDMTVSNSLVAGDGTILFSTNTVLTINGSDTIIDSGIVFDAGNGIADQVDVMDWTFVVSADTANQYVGFESLKLTDGALSGYGDLDAFNSVEVTGGVIEPLGGVLSMPSNFSVSGQPLLRIASDGINALALSNTGTFDLSSLDAEITIVSASGFDAVVLSAENGFANNSNEFSNVEVIDGELFYSFGLNYDYTNNEVSVVSKRAVDGEISSTLHYAGTESVRAGFGGMKNMVFARTKQLRRNLVSTAHAIPNETYLLTNTNAPAGAMGPGDQNTIFDMHIWLQQYSGQGDFDSQGPSDGYTLNNQGTTIGADRLVGEALTLGFNYTYARSSARTTDKDALDSETYWVGAYGEWVGEEGLYVDAMAAYGRSNYDSVRRDGNYLGTASYRGQAFGAYADVGQYYHSGELALSPYTGIRVLTILADDHNETDELGGSVYVDEVTRDLVESAIGLKMRHRFDTRIGRFQTTGYAEWAHDFIEDNVSATLTEAGFPSVETGSISPDADTLNVGLGCSWISTDYLEVGIGYAGRFSEHYEEHAGSLMLDIMF